MPISYIDTSLLQPREITRYIPDDESGHGGYLCDLACGHTIHLQLEPAISAHCGYCLERLVTQIREVQATQRIK